MLELIGSIVLVYYLVLGLALLIFLAWRLLDDRKMSKPRKDETRIGDDARAQLVSEAERDLPRQVKQPARLPDNVVRFKRRN